MVGGCILHNNHDVNIINNIMDMKSKENDQNYSWWKQLGGTILGGILREWNKKLVMSPKIKNKIVTNKYTTRPLWCLSYFSAIVNTLVVCFLLFKVNCGTNLQ